MGEGEWAMRSQLVEKMNEKKNNSKLSVSKNEIAGRDGKYEQQYKPKIIIIKMEKWWLLKWHKEHPSRHIYNNDRNHNKRNFN